MAETTVNLEMQVKLHKGHKTVPVRVHKDMAQALISYGLQQKITDCIAGKGTTVDERIKIQEEMINAIENGTARFSGRSANSDGKFILEVINMLLEKSDKPKLTRQEDAIKFYQKLKSTNKDAYLAATNHIEILRAASNKDSFSGIKV